jgi:hypothetical protein
MSAAQPRPAPNRSHTQLVVVYHQFLTVLNIAIYVDGLTPHARWLNPHFCRLDPLCLLLDSLFFLGKHGC